MIKHICNKSYGTDIIKRLEDIKYCPDMLRIDKKTLNLKPY